MASKRNLLREHTVLSQAIPLIAVGLRAPFVAELTGMSEWFVRKLVLDVLGHQPSRGQVPHSDLWFVRGRHHLHAVLFLSLYAPLKRSAGADIPKAEVLVSALLRYRHVIEKAGLPELLSADRAWWLLKMLAAKQLRVYRCLSCRGLFLMNSRDRRVPHHGSLCLSGRRAGRSVAYGMPEVSTL
jgi:hypothetical protein